MGLSTAEARLEKHSEPLRLYLMKFVVPALTGALVELCHEQPEDPVGGTERLFGARNRIKSLAKRRKS